MCCKVTNAIWLLNDLWMCPPSLAITWCNQPLKLPRALTMSSDFTLNHSSSTFAFKLATLPWRWHLNFPQNNPVNIDGLNMEKKVARYSTPRLREVGLAPVLHPWRAMAKCWILLATEIICWIVFIQPGKDSLVKIILVLFTSES